MPAFIYALLISCLSISTARAVTIPGSVDPGQVEKRFEPSPAEVPESPNLALPAPGKPAELSPQLQKQLAKKQFVLKSVVFDGVTAYKPEELKFAYEEMIGKTISLLDAETIAQRLTERYRHDGYILSQAVVPPQDVAGGVLKIRVVEGYVGNVTIKGDLTDGERKVLTSYADHIKQQRPVSTQSLERYLLLMNDLPGSVVKGILRPSATEFGAAELVVTATRQTLEGGYSVDNRGSKYIGPWQHTANIAGNSLLGMYDRTNLHVMTTSPDTTELRAFDLQHDEMLDSEGTKLSLLISHTHTEPGDTLEPLDIVGDSNLYEAKVAHPFIRSREENLSGRVVLDVHDTLTDVSDNVHFTEDRLRVARLGGTYTNLDGWSGNNVVDTQVSQGLDVLDPSSSGTDRSNPNGDSGFTKLNMDISRVQTLPYHFSVLAAVSGQYAFNPLLVAEQFSLGGADYGRAYDPATLLGDDGLAGKVELRYGQSVGEPYFDAYQFYGYYDVGRAWLRDGTLPQDHLSSLGGGVRATFTNNLAGSLELSTPLTSSVNTVDGYGGGSRIFCSFSAGF